MDQGRIAGIGNLLADEILWRAGLDPARPAGSLDDGERRTAAAALRAVLRTSCWRRAAATWGGCRRRGSARWPCPRDGTPLERRTIGGRTTYSCPRHQH